MDSSAIRALALEKAIQVVGVGADSKLIVKVAQTFEQYLRGTRV